MDLNFVCRQRAIAAATCLVAMAGTTTALHAADVAPAAEASSLSVQFVETFNKLSSGPHAGYRANHAKGILVTGSFTPAKGAAELSVAPHFAQPVAVTARFSDPTGVPTMPDASPNASPHGLAIRFELPGGSNADMVCISAHSFPVARPEDFLQMLQAVAASGPDVAKPKPIEKFLGGHPAAAKWVSTPRPAPVSFATLGFYGVNAFKFTNAAGTVRYARYEIIPDAGQAALTAEQAAAADPDYLMKELPQRIARGPVRFHLYAQVAGADDAINDATVEWPAQRERIELGTLSLDAVVPDQATAQKSLLYFNPLALPQGIDPSDDPILLARPPAYAVSFGQRMQ